MNKEIKFDVLIEGNKTGEGFRTVLTLNELLERNGCLFNTNTSKVVFARQFTGITDKNGVDVFQEDIIKTYHFTDGATRKKHYLYHTVKWSKKFHGWFLLNCSSMNENDGSIQFFSHIRAHEDFIVCGNSIER